MRLVGIVAVLVLALSAGGWILQSRFGTAETSVADRSDGLAAERAEPIRTLADISDKEITDVVLRNKLTSKPTTMKSLVGKNLSSLQSWLQYKKDFQALVAIDQEISQIADDLLNCRGAGSEDYIFRPMLNVIEDRSTTSTLPTARYRLNALVMRCPEVITGNVMLGIFHYESDLLLFDAVATKQLEDQCVAESDRDKRADCFKRNHKPTDRISDARIAALIKYMTSVAIKDGKSFMDYFMY